MIICGVLVDMHGLFIYLSISDFYSGRSDRPIYSCMKAFEWN